MRPITSPELLSDLTALLGGVGVRLGQAVGVTAVALVLLGLATPGTRCTKEGSYRASMKSDLRNLATAQDAYSQVHRAYAGSIEALGADAYATRAGVSVVLAEGHDAGWRALATHRGTPWLCVMYVGRAVQPVKGAGEGEPHCWEP